METPFLSGKRELSFYVSGGGMEKMKGRVQTDCLEMLRNLKLEVGKAPIWENPACCRTSSGPLPHAGFWKARGQASLPWDTGGCSVYFVHAEKIDVDGVALASPFHTVLQ